MNIRVNSQAAFDGAKAAGMNPIMVGAKLSKQRLDSLDFKSLRDAMSMEFIPTSGCSSKAELLAVYDSKWDADKTLLPLYRKRGAPGQQARSCFGIDDDAPEAERSDGRMGLVGCRNEACLNSEDGFVAFKCCSGCLGPMYCSVECQKIHWKAVHKLECKQNKKEHDARSKQDDDTRNIMNMMMGAIGNMK